MIQLSKKDKKLIKKHPISKEEWVGLEKSISQQLARVESKGVDKLSMKELKQLEIDCADTLSELQQNKDKYGEFQPFLVAGIQRVERFVKAEIQGRKNKKKG